jgi:hypothetical protein
MGRVAKTREDHDWRQFLEFHPELAVELIARDRLGAMVSEAKARGSP